MAGKMSPKFVALCSLAVGAIYSTGYSITANGSNQLAALTPEQAYASTPSANAANAPDHSSGASGQSSGGSATNNNSATSKSSHTGTQLATSTSHTTSSTTKKTSVTQTSKSSGSKTSTSSQTGSKATTSTSKPTNTSKYLDGTYNGSASNGIGMVAVAVSIHQGKIGNVQITACYTHYPEYYIDPVLPNYVVAHQTTNIPVVSGATLSTEDFYYAVEQALQQAQNPNYKG